MNPALRRFAPKLALSLLLGALFAWIVRRGGVPIVPSKASFASMDIRYVLLALAAALVTHGLRALRWRHLLRPIASLATRDVVAVGLVGFFAIFSLPLRLGEVVRPALARLRFQVPMSSAMGTVLVERVVDGLIASALVFWASLALPRAGDSGHLSQQLPWYAAVTTAAFVALALGLVVFLWQQARMIRCMTALVGLVSQRLAQRLSRELEALARGLRPMAQPRSLVPFLGESIAYWSLNGLSAFWLIVAFDLPLQPGHAVSVMGMLALGVLLPAGPGMFGNFQLAVSAALKMYLPLAIVGHQGAAFIFVYYAIQAFVVIGTGLVPLAVMHVSLGRLLALDTAKGPIESQS